MKYIFIVISIFIAGCCGMRESKWENTFNANTRLYTDKPQCIEYIDFGTSIKRSW